MKKQYLISISIVIFISINAFYTPPQPLEQIQTAYLKDMALFEKRLQSLKTEVDKISLSHTSNSKEHSQYTCNLKIAFKQARLAYKKVAWLIGYLEPDNEKCFNGSPLSKVETVNFTEIDPLGFQPIEEIIYGDDIESELPKLHRLINDLTLNAQR